MLFNVMQESYVAGRAKRQKANIEGEQMYFTSLCISYSIPIFGRHFKYMYTHTYTYIHKVRKEGLGLGGLILSCKAE